MIYRDCYCKKCQKEFEDQFDNECPECGNPMEVVYKKSNIDTHFKGSHNREYDKRKRRIK